MSAEHGVLLAVAHLACDKAAPDQAVELSRVARDALFHLGGRQSGVCGPHRLVGVLRGRGAFAFVGALLGTHILRAVGLGDELLGRGLRLVRNAQAVGTHVGDQAHGALPCNVHALVQRLGRAHGARCRKAQPAAGLLLHGGGDKRGRGHLFPLALADGGHGISRAVQGLDDLGALPGARHGQLPAARQRREARGEFFCGGRGAEQRVDVPVFLGLERLDLLFPVHDQAHGHALHTPRGKPPAHLFPQKGRELVAHQAVQHTAGLLGVEQVHINGARRGHALRHALFGDLAEGDAVFRRSVQAQQIGQMPADGLALTVRVGGEEHFVALLGQALKLLDDFFLALDVDILGSVAVLDVNAKLALGQVADVAHGGRHLISAAQVLADGLGFRRGFYDHEF